jgi:hypothetical protein
MRSLLRGAAAGAAGTTALNAATYLDMALRGRPASSTPQESVEKLSESAGVSIPGEREERDNRVAGLGPLMGLVTGVGVGVVLGALRGLGLRPPILVEAALATAVAMAGANAPMTATGLTDPRQWSATDWLADAIPHLAYGLVTASVLDGLDDD